MELVLMEPAFMEPAFMEPVVGRINQHPPRRELAHVRARLHPGTPNIPLEVAGRTPPSPPPQE